MKLYFYSSRFHLGVAGSKVSPDIALGQESVTSPPHVASLFIAVQNGILTGTISKLYSKTSDGRKMARQGTMSPTNFRPVKRELFRFGIPQSANKSVSVGQVE